MRSLKVILQQHGIGKCAVSGLIVFIKQLSEHAILGIGGMLFLQKGVSESQAGRDSIFPRPRKDCLRSADFCHDVAAVSDADCRNIIEKSDFAPVVEVLFKVNELNQ